MTFTHDRASTIATARRVLAADLSCPESALTDDGVLVTPFEMQPGRRGYVPPSKPMLILTMGDGVVVSCHPDRIEWLRATLGDRARDEIFSVPTIVELANYVARDGQVLRTRANVLLCSPELYRPPADPQGVTIEVVEGSAVIDLYRYKGFDNAFSYRPDHPCPDIAAAVASRDGEVLGIAAMSADAADLWQIGIDVVPGARRAGLGRALVGRLTELAFRQGKVPFYAVAISNIRSGALATSLGYWPAWSELSASDRPV